jgi:hypothetical protein
MALGLRRQPLDRETDFSCAVKEQHLRAPTGLQDVIGDPGSDRERRRFAQDCLDLARRVGRAPESTVGECLIDFRLLASGTAGFQCVDRSVVLAREVGSVAQTIQLPGRHQRVEPTRSLQKLDTLGRALNPKRIRQEGVTDAYVCRLLPLTCLAPDMVETILDGGSRRI